MKQIVRLNERDLRRMVMESVTRLLNEYSEKDINGLSLKSISDLLLIWKNEVFENKTNAESDDFWNDFDEVSDFNEVNDDDVKSLGGEGVNGNVKKADGYDESYSEYKTPGFWALYKKLTDNNCAGLKQLVNMNTLSSYLDFDMNCRKDDSAGLITADEYNRIKGGNSGWKMYTNSKDRSLNGKYAYKVKRVGNYRVNNALLYDIIEMHGSDMIINVCGDAEKILLADSAEKLTRNFINALQKQVQHYIRDKKSNDFLNDEMPGASVSDEYDENTVEKVPENARSYMENPDDIENRVVESLNEMKEMFTFIGNLDPNNDTAVIKFGVPKYDPKHYRTGLVVKVSKFIADNFDTIFSQDVISDMERNTASDTDFLRMFRQYAEDFCVDNMENVSKKSMHYYYWPLIFDDVYIIVDGKKVPNPKAVGYYREIKALMNQSQGGSRHGKDRSRKLKPTKQTDINENYLRHIIRESVRRCFGLL